MLWLQAERTVQIRSSRGLKFSLIICLQKKFTQPPCLGYKWKDAQHHPRATIYMSQASNIHGGQRFGVPEMDNSGHEHVFLFMVELWSYEGRIFFVSSGCWGEEGKEEVLEGYFSVLYTLYLQG